MARPSKTTIKELLAEYGQLEVRRVDIELKRDAELEPLRTAYTKKCAPIVDAAQQRLSPIQERLKCLAGQIEAQLMAGVDQTAETVALKEVVCEIETKKAVAALIAKRNNADVESSLVTGKPIVRAVAQVDSKPGNREIDSKTLFARVPESERNDTFWTKVVRVMVGEAEKFLGKEKLDQLSRAPRKFSVSIGLKP